MVFVTLSVKFIFFSDWSVKKSGIILTHLGVLILLLGGLITAKFAHESFMVIPEGESISSVSEYRERVVTLSKNDEIIAEKPFESVAIGGLFQGHDLPFQAIAKYICANCTMDFQDPDIAENAHGLAQKVTLKNIPLEKENETNLSGIMVDIDGAQNAQDGHYIMMESVADTITITHDGDTYSIHAGRVQQPLPFDIKLVDFRRIVYPGTDKPSGFESDIIINDGDIKWPVTIKMNEPARYKGYTFFQSSFVQRPDKEVTVLNVVQNAGHIFPYISTFIIFLGLLIHSIFKIRYRVMT